MAAKYVVKYSIWTQLEVEIWKVDGEHEELVDHAPEPWFEDVTDKVAMALDLPDAVREMNRMALGPWYGGWSVEDLKDAESRMLAEWLAEKELSNE